MRLRHLLGPLPSVEWSSLITLGFCLFFVGLCWYVYRRDRRGVYQHLEQLPFQGGEND